MSENNEVENFLEHFGVKGMKWGVRNAASSVKGAASTVRQNVKDHDQSILDARAKLPEARNQYKSDKKQFKADKIEMGRKAAKAILKEKGKTFYETRNKAYEETSAEVITGIIGRQVSISVQQRNRQRSLGL